MATWWQDRDCWPNTLVGITAYRTRSPWVRRGVSMSAPAAPFRSCGKPARWPSSISRRPNRRGHNPFLTRSHDLTGPGVDAFQAVAGCNLGIRREFYDRIRGSDESLVKRESEDVELGYRAFAHGGLLVPLQGAWGWHLGLWEEERDRRSGERLPYSGRMANLVPSIPCRSGSSTHIFRVPKHVVTLEAGNDPLGQTARAVEAVLADPAGDVAILVLVAPHAASCETQWFTERFGSDPRVRIASKGTSLEIFPISPFHATLPARAELASGLLSALLDDLGEGVSATRNLDGGAKATIGTLVGASPCPSHRTSARRLRGCHRRPAPVPQREESGAREDRCASGDTVESRTQDPRCPAACEAGCDQDRNAFASSGEIKGCTAAIRLVLARSDGRDAGSPGSSSTRGAERRSRGRRPTAGLSANGRGADG